MTKKIEEAAKLGRRLPKIEENIREMQVRTSGLLNVNVDSCFLSALRKPSMPRALRLPNLMPS